MCRRRVGRAEHVPEAGVIIGTRITHLLPSSSRPPTSAGGLAQFAGVHPAIAGKCPGQARRDLMRPGLRSQGDA
jgi:hypothetical protein